MSWDNERDKVESHHQTHDELFVYGKSNALNDSGSLEYKTLESQLSGSAVSLSNPDNARQSNACTKSNERSASSSSESRSRLNLLGTETTSARRRKQNREAQRAYRERKASRIQDLERNVETLNGLLKSWEKKYKELETEYSLVKSELSRTTEENRYLKSLNPTNNVGDDSQNMIMSTKLNDVLENFKPVKAVSYVRKKRKVKSPLESEVFKNSNTDEFFEIGRDYGKTSSNSSIMRERETDSETRTPEQLSNPSSVNDNHLRVGGSPLINAIKASDMASPNLSKLAHEISDWKKLESDTYSVSNEMCDSTPNKLKIKDELSIQCDESSNNLFQNIGPINQDNSASACKTQNMGNCGSLTNLQSSHTVNEGNSRLPLIEPSCSSSSEGLRMVSDDIGSEQNSVRSLRHLLADTNNRGRDVESDSVNAALRNMDKRAA